MRQRSGTPCNWFILGSGRSLGEVYWAYVWCSFFHASPPEIGSFPESQTHTVALSKDTQVPAFKEFTRVIAFSDMKSYLNDLRGVERPRGIYASEVWKHSECFFVVVGTV